MTVICGRVVDLDADQHAYSIDARPTEGVTSIIKEAGLADWRWVTDYYRDRGSRGHQAIHYCILHDLDLASCDDDIVGYVISVANFLKAHNARTVAVERRVASFTLWYAGTLDWIGLLDSCGNVACCPRPFRNALTLVDWKTSKTFHPATAIQTIAYADAWYEETKQIPMRRACVLADEDGGPARQKEYPAADHRTDRDTWRAALTCCAWRKKNGIRSLYLDNEAA